LDQLAELRRLAADREAKWRSWRRRLARSLWLRSQPLGGSVGERYVRQSRCYTGSLPATLRFLPNAGHSQHPALIAAFCVAEEPEPGVLSITHDSIVGVHLTRVSLDGTSKAGTPRDKIMIGKSAGWPIYLAAFNDQLGLAIAEGIENALSVAEATGLAAWASGCASRLPSLASKVPWWVDCVTVVADPDPTGRKYAQALLQRLTLRGISTEIVEFGRARGSS
jgi:hypothetical protein